MSLPANPSSLRSTLAALALVALGCGSSNGGVGANGGGDDGGSADSGTTTTSPTTSPSTGGSDAAPAESSAPDGCTPIDIGTISAGITGPAGASVTGGVTPAIGAKNTTLGIELYAGSGFDQTAGSFDLSAETDYGACHHCVVVYVDGSDAGTARKMFFQKSGHMTLTTVDKIPTVESTGSLDAVELVEVTVDSSFHSKPVTGGKCLYIAHSSWNTVVAAGTKCSQASDCVDTSKLVCDPGTGTRVPGQCSAASPCPSGQACVYQASGVSVGACYPACTPFVGSTGCSADSECVVSRFDGTAGYCKKRGSIAADLPCKRSDVSTSCVAGYQCDQVDLKCRAQCAFWSSPSCSGAGQFCAPPGVCTNQAHDAALLGAACAASSVNGTPCSASGPGGALEGVCTGAVSPPYTCQKWCRYGGSASDCRPGQSCTATTVPSLGYCK